MRHDPNAKFFGAGKAAIAHLGVLTCLLFLYGSSLAQPQPPPRRAEFVPEEVLIKYVEDVGSEEAKQLEDNEQASLLSTSHRGRIRRLRLRRGASVSATIARLRSDPRIKYAEPNYIYYPILTPDDPDYSQLWGLNNSGQSGGAADADIDAPEAWDITTGSPDVLIAVTDTGVQVAPGFSGQVSTHPDLVANLWVNPGEIPGNGVDDDGNGYVDDIHGWNFFDNAAWLFYSATEDDHGTHTAGTMAAEGGNGIGVTGVNWQAQLMVLKFLGWNGGTTAGAIEAIEYATAKGAKVINASWGGGGFSQALKDAIESCNCVFVAAAGNNGEDTDASPHYPSSYDSPNLISVAATDRNDRLASFSNFGATSVDLGAPGVSIRSTVPNSTYSSFSGTSMAAPHVSGVAGLVYSLSPGLTGAQVKAQILAGADPLTELGGLTVTGGRLNAVNALSEAPPPAPSQWLAEDDFESCGYNGGSGWLASWSTSGRIAIRQNRDGPHSGSCHVRLWSGNGYMERSVDVTGLSEIHLQFWSKVYSFESSDNAYVQVSPDGSNWTTVKTFTSSASDNTYYAYDIDVSGVATSGQLFVAFKAEMNSSRDRWFIDDVRLSGSGVTSPNTPPTANLSAPGNGTTYLTTDSIAFSGTGDDTEQGALTGGALVWTSNLDGQIGIGVSFSANLTDGSHTITLTATDNQGQTATDSVNIAVNQAGGVAIQVFADSFEVSEWNGLWTEDNQNDWFRSSQRATDGNFSAEVDGRASDASLTSIPIDLQGRTGATVTFSWYIESRVDSGEYLAFDVSTDGGTTWAEKVRLRGNLDAENTWHDESINLVNIDSLRIRFRGGMNRSNEDADLDNVKIMAQ